MGNYAGLTVLGANRYDNLGRTVADAGDVNGDGFADFLVVAPYADITGRYSNDGAVYVVFGTADGPATLEVADLDGSNGYLLTQPRNTETFQSLFTRQVAGIGDINGDGFDDIAIAGRTTINYSYGQDRTATTDIYVVFGAATVPGAVVDIDDAPGFQVFGVNGRVNDLAAAGDVNGDGIDDFLISQSPLSLSGYYGNIAQRATGQGPDGSIDPNGSYGGFVIFGDNSITNGIGGASGLDVALLDGTDGFAIAIERSTVRGYFGEIGYSETYSSSVTAIGDVNGDGFGDLFVRSTVATRELVEGTDFYGNPFSYYNNVTERRSFVVFGDNDGFDNVIDPTDPTQASEVFWDGVNSDNSGRYSTANRVERLGDINGDGFDDVGVALRGRYVTISGPDGDVSARAGIAIYLGGPDGIDVEGDRDGNADGQVDGLPPTGNPDQIAAGPDLVVVYSGSNYIGLGQSIAGIGDINGDGFDDFAISAPYAYIRTELSRVDEAAAAVVAPVNRSSVFVVFGREIETNGTQVVDLADNTTFGYRFVSSQNNNYTGFGRSISAAGDLNNDGFDDFIIGESFFNAPATPGSSEGAAFVIYGGANGLEAADNADGANDNVIDVANLDVDVGTGVVPIQVSIQNAGQFGAFVSEGDAGATIASFTLQRTGNLTEGVTVNFDVAGFGVNAANAADFLAGATTGTVTFAAGSAFATLDIAIQGDRTIEATEDFSVTLSNAVSTGGSPISITGSQSFGRIFNDDQPVFVQVFGLSRDENDPNGVGFRVQRFGDIDVAVTFNFEITGLSASSDDVVGGLPRTGSITLAAGETFRDILIDPTDDFIIEANETIRIQLSNIAAPDAEELTVLNTTATATIINDDFGPRITVRGGGSVFEGNSGQTPVTFVIERSGTLDGALTVDYALNPLTVLQAANSADVNVPLPSIGQVTFADGEASKTVTVLINGDRTIEPNEFFELRVTGFDSEANVPYELFQIAQTVTIRTDDGVPPVFPPGLNGASFGDPHIVTLDGLGYEFQAVGEYVLLETTSGATNPFQIQVRYEPLPGSDLVSVTTRLAVQVGGVTIEIDAFGDAPLRINGAAASQAALLAGAIDVNGDDVADVFISGNTFTIVLNAANEQIQVGRSDGLLNVNVALSNEPGGNVGQVRGLMGNANGAVGDDFQLRDGSALPAGVQTVTAGVPSLDFDFLYGRNEFAGSGFADSWRLQTTERLFSNTTTFPDTFPAALLTLDDLPADLLAAAQAAATAAGLVAGTPAFNAAVLDFALTGDEDFLAGAAGAADATVNSTPTGAPVLPATVGVTAGEANLTEGDSGLASALFTFYRIGDASQALTVDYALTGDINADDLAPGTALTGTVTFAAGATSASISVGVRGDLASEDDESLIVQITGASDPNALVGASRATTVVETDDFAPEAADDTFSTAANESLSGNLFENNENGADSDADNDTLTVVGLSVGAVGDLITLDSGAVLRVGADGALTFDAFGNAGDAFDSDYDALGAGEVASETFTYQVADGNGGVDTATVTINVTGRNDGPVVIDDLAASFGEDDSIAADLLAPNLVADPDGDDLDLASATINAGGRVIQSSVDLETGALTLADGQFNDLAEGEELVLTVDYTVTDGVASTTTSATLTITGTNDGPTVLDQGAFETDEDTGVSIDLLDPALVTDVDGDTLTVVSVAASASDGRAVQASIDSATGEVVLDPAQFNDLAEGEELVVTLDHLITDGFESVENTATLTVIGRNDGPVALAAGVFAAAEDASVITAQLLGAALVTDPDGDDLDVGTVAVTAADGRAINFTVDAETGVLQIAPGQFEDLGRDETLVLDIDYTASDGRASVDNSASLTITGANDGPSVRAQGSFSFGEDAAVSSFNLLTADLVADVDGDDLDLGTVSITETNGRTVVFTTDAETGQVTLSPGQFNSLRAGQSLTLTVAHTVTDGLVSVNNTATVTITGANDAPRILSANAFSVAENGTAVGTVVGLDVDAGTTLSYSIQGGADAARFAIDANTGALRFVAAPNFEAPTDAGGNNVYDVRVGVSDGTALVTQDIAVTVTDVAENVRRVIEGSNGIDSLRGTRADEILRSKAGLVDFMTGGGGSDIFEFGAETRNGRREVDTITDFRNGDFLDLGDATIVREVNLLGSTFLTLSGDGDTIILLGLRDFTDAQLI